MLTVNQINKSYGITPVLQNISFSINPGDRCGLIGINGSGKTTLLRILNGKVKPDSGTFRFSPANLRAGYLPQGANFEDQDTIESFLDRYCGNQEALALELEQLSASIMIDEANQELQTRFDEILALLEISRESANRKESVLVAFGLDRAGQDTPVSHLSGGQKIRLILASVLLTNPGLLLLDEPTNHLDIAMLTWLESWINQFKGAVMIVSHDRIFLDNTVNKILELDEHTHEINTYHGNYCDYLKSKQEEQDKHWQRYKDQQDEIQRLQIAAMDMRSKAKYRPGGKTDPSKTDGFSIGFFANRTKEIIQKAKNIEKRVDSLLSDESIDKPARTWQMRIDFGDQPRSGREVLQLSDLAIGYGKSALLKDINQTLRYGERVAFIGANGSGKTTLLKTISGEIAALHGQVRLGANVNLGYMTQEQRELDPKLNALESMQKFAAINETGQRSFLSKFLFKGDEVFIPVEKLSFGERARLSLACLVAAGCNFLILDEPVNHLDIPSRTQFELALSNFKGTILAVVHDRYFINAFAKSIWEVAGDTIIMREI